MKTIEIYGKNHSEQCNHVRVGCRGIVLKNDKILMTYEVNTDQWFIPGGGLEADESLMECCVRELAEETGCVVEPKEHFLTLNEYYEDWLFVSHYFICDYVGETERVLTEREIAIGLEPRWISLEEAIDIFEKYQDYGDETVMKRNAYLREYTAFLNYMER